MNRLLVFSIAACCLVATVSALALAASGGGSGRIELGPFHGSGFQLTGTCGNVWGTMSATTRYSVYPRNRNGSITAVQTVDAVVTSAAGHSPNACYGGPDNGSTIAAGVHAHLHSIEEETISGGAFNPNAHCASQCFTAAFVPAFFGPGATVKPDADFGDWTTPCNGSFVETGINDLQIAGDITGTPHHCT